MICFPPEAVVLHQYCLLQQILCFVVQATMDAIAILMGWPSLGTALLLSIAGAWSRKPVWIWIGVVLVIPMALYVSAMPAFPFVGVIPLFALVVAALTCRKTPRWPSLAGISVYAMFMLALAFIVINQPIH
jgi:hypothetical protein